MRRKKVGVARTLDTDWAERLAQIEVTSDKRLFGKKSKLNKRAVLEILKAIARGASRRDACMCQGVHPGMLTSAMSRNYDIARFVEEAEARCKVHHIETIYNNENRWQASAWFLERRFRDEYSFYGDGGEQNDRIIKVRKEVIDKLSKKLVGFPNTQEAADHRKAKQAERDAHISEHDRGEKD